MKQRWQNLTKTQKIIILTLVGMALLFRILYTLAAGTSGVAYGDIFLALHQNGPETVYFGRKEGAGLTITVQPDRSISTQWGEVSHGPYTVREDPVALPEKTVIEGTTGVEIREGDTIRFRGGWNGHVGLLQSTSGEMTSLLEIRSSVDPPQREVSLGFLMQLWEGPELVSCGVEIMYLTAFIVSLAAVLELIFANELFRFHMAWHVENPEQVEPSEWERIARTGGGIFLALLALATYCMGLTSIG